MCLENNRENNILVQSWSLNNAVWDQAKFTALLRDPAAAALFRKLSLHAFQSNGTHPNRLYTDSATTCVTKKECDTVVSKIPAACF